VIKFREARLLPPAPPPFTLKQLLLDFTRPPAPTFANFVAGGNAEALAALEAAAQGRFPERVVYLWGESGAGKSHLATAFAQETSQPVRIVDDVERLGEAEQIELFDAFNERAFPFLLVTASAAPRDVALRRDLATRLATGLTYRLLPLSDEEKRTALVAHARSRGFELGDEVARYLLTHARRDMGSLVSALDAIDRYSLETGRAVTVPLLKSALAA
jgi:DnaA family protein